MTISAITDTLEMKQLSRQLSIESCPFCNQTAGQCKISQINISDSRKRFCHSDEYDGCPTYLGYLLRRTNPLRSDHDWLDSTES